MSYDYSQFRSSEQPIPTTRAPSLPRSNSVPADLGSSRLLNNIANSASSPALRGRNIATHDLGNESDFEELTKSGSGARDKRFFSTPKTTPQATPTGSPLKTTRTFRRIFSRTSSPLPSIVEGAKMANISSSSSSSLPPSQQPGSIFFIPDSPSVGQASSKDRLKQWTSLGFREKVGVTPRNSADDLVRSESVDPWGFDSTPKVTPLRSESVDPWSLDDTPLAASQTTTQVTPKVTSRRLGVIRTSSSNISAPPTPILSSTPHVKKDDSKK